MSSLAAEFRPGTTELPLVALVRLVIAPVACVLSLALCMLVYREPVTRLYATLALAAALVTLQVFREMPLSNGHGRFMPGGAVLTDWLTVVGILLLLGFATKLSGLYSRKVVLTWFAVTPFVLHATREAARILLHEFVGSGARARTKVIVGANEAGSALAREIAKDRCRGMLRGFFDDRDCTRLAGVRPERILGRIADVAEFVKRHSINVVYIALPMSRDPRLVRLLNELRDTTASVYFVPSALPHGLIQARVDYIGEVPVIAVCETPLYGIDGVLKRAVDVLVSSMVLLLIWPFMLAIAVGVKRSSPGPVLFKQRRYGLDGREILVYKFRTMTVCEDGAQIEQAKRDDPRVTAFGAFLRKTSLDELPQLLNVLEGTMSIVGPRPHAVAHNEQYRKLIDGYMLRHKVRPGITGWAQVNGCRGETESVEKMEKRIQYDLDYLRNWSLSLDLWIMFRTFFVVFRDRNAY